MDLSANPANCHIRQHPDLALQLKSEHFDASFWEDKAGFQVISGGRGGSVRINLDGRSAILRHYYRGGLVRRLLTDEYLWLGKKLSRPWREWAILEYARQSGLPVPVPMTACVCRTGLWYRAAIITEYLEQTETLAKRLAESELDHKGWYLLGVLIRRLQSERIRHSDLNASNILIDNQDRFYIIDFDRARVMNRLGDWQWRTLHRLQRSLDKFDRSLGLKYRPDDWQALMDGYQS